MLCAGCENIVEHDVKIANESSYIVSFQLERYSDTIYTLGSGESITLKIFNDPVLTFSGNPRVGYESADKVKIYDLPAYTYSVINNSAASVILGEKNGLLGDNYNDTITIEGGEVKTAKVYTKSPQWVAYFADSETIDALEWLSFSN